MSVNNKGIAQILFIMAKYLVNGKVSEMTSHVHHCGLVSFLENNGCEGFYPLLQYVEGAEPSDLWSGLQFWTKTIEEFTGITSAEELSAAVKAHEFLCVQWTGEGDKHSVLLIKGTNVVSVLGVFDTYEDAVEDALSLASV
jgi:hypothetical protein